MSVIFPKWIQQQPEYNRVIRLGMINIEPWTFYIDNNDFTIRMNGLKERFPEVELVPFARREDCDDIPCWEKSNGNIKVFIIHDFSTSGWVQGKEYANFWTWYRL